MANLGVKLTANHTMQPGDYLESPSGLYTLTMTAGGDLVLDATSPGAVPIWKAGTSGNGNYCKMSANGDLIIYNSAGTHIEHSGTSGNNGAYLIIGDDGSIRILTASGAELSVPWDDGPMYSYPGAAFVTRGISALLDKLQSNVDEARRAVTQLQNTAQSQPSRPSATAGAHGHNGASA